MKAQEAMRLLDISRPTLGKYVKVGKIRAERNPNGHFSTTPIQLDWALPQTIDFSLGEDTQVYENHLFIPTEGSDFKASLNDWESGVVNE
jgi:hypothetical protein